jgi:hypothetical protein
MRLSLRPPAFGAWAVRHSYAVNVHYFRWQQRRALQETGLDVGEEFAGAYTGELWAWQRDQLRRLRGLVEGAGGRLVVITMPDLRGMSRGEGPLANMHEAVASFWAEEGIPHLDLLAVLEDLEGDQLVVNGNDAHPSVRAHAVVAATLVPFLDELLTAKETARPSDGGPR